MNFTNTNPISYQFYRPSKGTFKTGSGPETQDMGNTLTFTPEAIKFKVNKNDNGKEEFSVWFREGENVLSMRNLAALQVLKYTGGEITIQASPKEITLENGTKTIGTNLFVEGEVQNPEYLIIKEDHNGIELTDWEETILGYVSVLHYDLLNFKLGRWIKTEALPLPDPINLPEEMKLPEPLPEAPEPEQEAPEVEEIPSPAQKTIDQNQRKGGKRKNLIDRIFTDEV